MSGLKAYQANAGQPNAATKTIVDVGVLVAGLTAAAGSFYEGTDRLGTNGNEWKVQGKSVKKTAVKGTNSESGLKGVPPPARSNHWIFGVTRLAESTTIDLVKRHLQQSGIEVQDVWILNSKVKGTKTAKVRVAIEHRERAKSPALWPVYSQVRDWDFGRPKRGNVGEPVLAAAVTVQV